MASSYTNHSATWCKYLKGQCKHYQLTGNIATKISYKNVNFLFQDTTHYLFRKKHYYVHIRQHLCQYFSSCVCLFYPYCSYQWTCISSKFCNKIGLVVVPTRFGLGLKFIYFKIVNHYLAN